MIPSPQIILAGLLIGIVVAAPVGPVNVLCIQRTLERGFLAGMSAGLGAVLGDGLIALVAAFGINAISDIVLKNRAIFQIIGGTVLAIFGLKLFFTPPRFHADREVHAEGRPPSLLTYIWSVPQTFFLTITNPGAVLGMFAIVGGAGSALGGLDTSAEAITLVLAVMAGSLLWWFAIARIISTVRHKLNDRRLRMINQFAGVVLIGFGVVVLAQLLFRSIGSAA
jgi:threonine/homoserine/homoserine lactone efflux protein